jgi:hypothetical protein
VALVIAAGLFVPALVEAAPQPRGSALSLRLVQVIAAGDRAPLVDADRLPTAAAR